MSLISNEIKLNRVFITGGSGFIGSHLIDYLIKQNVAEIICLARSEKAADTVRKAGATDICYGDVNASLDILKPAMSKCDAVFHLAANVQTWSRNYDDFQRATVDGTRTILQAASEVGVKRFIHCSTEAVLSPNGPLINADETWPVPTNIPKQYCYSRSKADAENLVRNYPDSIMSCMIIRPRFVWGRGDPILLPLFLSKMQQHKWMWIDGGQMLTSTCHVRNVCEGMYLAAIRGQSKEIYFLKDERNSTIRAFINQLVETQSVQSNGMSIPFWLAFIIGWLLEFIWKLGDFHISPPLTRQRCILFGREMTVNDMKARRELGYQSHVTIQQGMNELIDDYKNGYIYNKIRY